MRFLPDVHHIDWRHDFGAAITIVALPAVMLLAIDARTLMFGILVMVVMSFVAGYWIAPHDLWLTWGVAFLLTWGTFGIADRIGAMGEGEPVPGMTPLFVGLLTLVPMVPVALVPLWTGRLLRRDNARIAERRRAAEPH